MAKFFCDRAENIVGTRENATFFLYPQCFQKVSFQGCLKLGFCGNRDLKGGTGQKTK